MLHFWKSHACPGGAPPPPLCDLLPQAAPLPGVVAHAENGCSGSELVGNPCYVCPGFSHFLYILGISGGLRAVSLYMGL